MRIDKVKNNIFIEANNLLTVFIGTNEGKPQNLNPKYQSLCATLL